MKRRYVGLALVLASALGWGSVAQGRSDAQPLSATAKSAITAQLHAAVASGDAPGMVALIVDRNGEVYSATVGKLDPASEVPMPADAIFNIASMTKPVTSVAIMMLLDQGKLALDDAVSKYLPGFDNLQVITRFNEADGSYDTRPAKRVMTLRHLLTHTSGIGYAFSNPIVARLQKDTDKLEWELPLLNDPGEKWNYSASTRVLGLIVEKITGMPLEDHYQQHIFLPLGMVDTSYVVAADKQPRMAAVLMRVDGALQPRPRTPVASTPTPPYRGDGGLYSTAHDYGLFMRMLLNGGRLGPTRILSERSVRLMGQNHIGAIFVEQQAVGNPALTRPFPLGAGRDKFGLGFQVAAQSDDARTYRSAGSLSWAGLFNTEFWIDPQLQVGGVLLMQMLPFYDEGAIRTLQNFEKAAYRSLR
jgi:CubicO group peptidase (beta-lactamase class C family)